VSQLPHSCGSQGWTNVELRFRTERRTMPMAVFTMKPSLHLMGMRSSGQGSKAVRTREIEQLKGILASAIPLVWGYGERICICTFTCSYTASGAKTAKVNHLSQERYSSLSKRYSWKHACKSPTFHTYWIIESYIDILWYFILCNWEEATCWCIFYTCTFISAWVVRTRARVFPSACGLLTIVDTPWHTINVDKLW
jgi:hypothetical protein